MDRTERIISLIRELVGNDALTTVEVREALEEILEEVSARLDVLDE